VLVYVDRDLVGDALMKLPFLRALRRAFPTGELIWAAGKGSTAYAGDLAGLTVGLLDRVVEGCGPGPMLSAVLGGSRLELVVDTQTRVRTTLALRRLQPRRFVSSAGGYLLSDVSPPRGYRRPRWMIRRLLDLLEMATGKEAIADGALPIPHATKLLAAELLPGWQTYVAQVVGACEGLATAATHRAGVPVAGRGARAAKRAGALPVARRCASGREISFAGSRAGGPEAEPGARSVVWRAWPPTAAAGICWRRGAFRSCHCSG
jgi:hypothetical protein